MRIRSRLMLAGLLVSSALLLAACGGSGAKLIPESNAASLRSDFRAVAEAAQEGNGECAATERAIRRMNEDFRSLPNSVDAGLHAKLQEGVENLGSRALVTCERQTSTTKSTSSTTTSATTSSTPTTTTTNSTTTPSSTVSRQTSSDTYTYSETATAPPTQSETGGTEATGPEGSPGGATAEEPESPPAAEEGEEGEGAGGAP